MNTCNALKDIHESRKLKASENKPELMTLKEQGPVLTETEQEMAPLCQVNEVLQANVDVLQANVVDKQSKEHSILVARLKNVKDGYRDWARDCMDDNEIDSIMTKACKEAPESKRLRAIHDAHKAAESKAKQIEQTKGALENLRKLVGRVKAQRQAKDKKVHANAHVYGHALS